VTDDVIVVDVTDDDVKCPAIYHRFLMMTSNMKRIYT
jgi:hypothetical protein